MLATACAFSLLALFLNETVVLLYRHRLDLGQDGELFQSSGAFWYQRGNTLFEVKGVRIATTRHSRVS